MKLDCTGYVQKRLGNALDEFQKSSVKLDDGKPMKGKNGRLTKAAIEKLKIVIWQGNSQQCKERHYNY